MHRRPKKRIANRDANRIKLWLDSLVPGDRRQITCDNCGKELSNRECWIKCNKCGYDKFEKNHA